ncbi:hypothetical protein BC629DRAFT_257635 [Irpex lacteus]|nr:hypothetical protein BC629DRAFT_257635 [Irpex lacteus]
MSPSDPKLPIELIEQIIDHLHSTPLALATCKLVHRTWLPRARTHLHRTIIFELGGPDPFALRFFVPQVALHVRELVVSYRLLREVGASVLAELDLVEVLHVVADLASTSIRASERLVSAADFPRFSRLKRLHINTLGFATQLAVLSSLTTKASTISFLTVDIHPPRHISQFLTDARAQETLRKCPTVGLKSLDLRYKWFDSRSHGALPQAILQLSGKELRHLTFTDMQHDSPQAFCEYEYPHHNISTFYSLLS